MGFSSATRPSRVNPPIGAFGSLMCGRKDVNRGSFVYLHELSRELSLTLPEMYDYADAWGFELDRDTPILPHIVELLRAEADRLRVEAESRQRMLLSGPRVWRSPKRVRVSTLPPIVHKLLRVERVLTQGERGRTSPLPREIPADEAETLKEIGGSWLIEFFTPEEIGRWLVAHNCQIGADTAAAFRRVGVSAEAAATRLWYGKVNKNRPSLAERVEARELTPEAAAADLRAAGLLAPRAA